MGESTTTGLVTLAGMLQLVGKVIVLAQFDITTRLNHATSTYLSCKTIIGPVLDDDRSDLHYEHSAQSTPPAASDHKSRHVVDDTLDLVNQLLRENQKLPKQYSQIRRHSWKQI